MVMDGEAWHAALHEVTKSWTQLSNRTELNILMRFPRCLPMQKTQQTQV